MTAWCKFMSLMPLIALFVLTISAVPAQQDNVNGTAVCRAINITLTHSIPEFEIEHCEKPCC